MFFVSFYFFSNIFIDYLLNSWYSE